MADVTVAQFAEVLKVPIEKLLSQLEDAGITVAGADDTISEDAKMELLTYLRRSHGQEDTSTPGAPRRITLRRKSQSELKLSGAQGRSRTVNVEVRRKRTYIKRDVLEKEAQRKQEELDNQRREEQERVEAEQREQERLKAEIRSRLLVGTAIELVPYGTLPRETYKAKLIDYSDVETTKAATA